MNDSILLIRSKDPTIANFRQLWATDGITIPFVSVGGSGAATSSTRSAQAQSEWFIPAH
jgi:hypothetical protein